MNGAGLCRLLQGPYPLAPASLLGFVGYAGFPPIVPPCEGGIRIGSGFEGFGKIREMPGGGSTYGDSASNTRKVRAGSENDRAEPWEVIIPKLMNG